MSENFEVNVLQSIDSEIGESLVVLNDLEVALDEIGAGADDLKSAPLPGSVQGTSQSIERLDDLSSRIVLVNKRFGNQKILLADLKRELAEEFIDLDLQKFPRINMALEKIEKLQVVIDDLTTQIPVTRVALVARLDYLSSVLGRVESVLNEKTLQ